MDLWGSSNLGGGGSSTATLPDQISNLACTGGTDGSHGTIDVSFTEVPVTSFDLLKYYILIYKEGGIPQSPFDGTRITLPKGTAGAKLEYQIIGLTFDQLYGVRIYPVSVKNQFQTLAEGATATATPIEFDAQDWLYHTDTDTDKLYRLDPETLAPLQSADAFYINPMGIGGTRNRLYYVGYFKQQIYRLDPRSIAPIKTVNSVGTSPKSIGGTQHKLLHTDWDSRKIYRLDEHTYTPLQTVDTPEKQPFDGIGGTQYNVYICGYNADKIYKLDPDVLTPIKSVDALGKTALGIGGIRDKLYHCDGGVSSASIASKIYRLDPDILTPIKSVNSIGGRASGIGGIK